MYLELSSAKHIKIINILINPDLILKYFTIIDAEPIKKGEIYGKMTISYNLSLYAIDEDIISVFGKAQELTIELMESSNNSKYLKDCLKLIFVAFMKVFSKAIEMYHSVMPRILKDDYPVKRANYIVAYKEHLLEYYLFIKPFINKEDFDEINIVYCTGFDNNFEYHTERSAKHFLNYEIKPQNNQSNLNIYPRIFTSINAFNRFEKLLEKFGSSDENLANYSFVYHRMIGDGLIFEDFQKVQFVYFLLDFDINIDRIKRIEDIGKITFRDNIYNQTK
jgi:hypothetical protein